MNDLTMNKFLSSILLPLLLTSPVLAIAGTDSPRTSEELSAERFYRNCFHQKFLLSKSAAKELRDAAFFSIFACQNERNVLIKAIGNSDSNSNVSRVENLDRKLVESVLKQ